MPFKPVSIPQEEDTPMQTWSPPNLYGGVIYTDLQNKIPDDKSPDMLNMWYQEKILSKRFGQAWANPSQGNFPVFNAYKRKYNGKIIFHAGTKLYSMDPSDGTTTELYSGLTADKGSFFVFNKNGTNILYYKNGHEYIQYNGTTVTNVVGYIPKVITGRAPSGGGNVLEQYNRLSAGFINSFSGNGSSTAYQLTLSGLDATTVTCTISGVVKTEGVDFTVNRTTGTVTFSVAPASGTDNVLITAYKTDSASTAAFMVTKYVELYGGTNNDNRVFFAGGSNTYYYSGLLDPTYIPENQYNNLGDGLDLIYGFGKQYNTLVVFKGRSIYAIRYEVSADGSNPRFPCEQLNDTKGCDMPWTIQIINNSLVWCHTEQGVQILNRTDTKDEKNVSPISFNINGTLQSPGLSSQPNLTSATSYDYWGMYWLCVGSKVWVWDYSITSFVQTGDDYTSATRLAWFPLDNINANCFFDADGVLYYGSRTIGRIAKFADTHNDFGNTAINGYWKTKKLDFGLFDWTKYILKADYSTKSNVATKVTTTHYFDDGSRVDTKIDNVYSFNWATAKWNTWNWKVINFAVTIAKYIKKGNTIYYQIKFENNNANEDLTILDLAIYFVLQRRVR